MQSLFPFVFLGAFAVSPGLAQTVSVAAASRSTAAGARDVSGAVRLRQLVSQASGGQEKPKPVKKAPAAVKKAP